LAELTPALCQAVTGREDAPAILEDLYRRSLFLAAMSDERPTTDSEGRRGAIPPSFFAGRHYRYHALFAEFLCQRLAQEMPERVIELHRQAAEAETVPARAINHYLAAQMPERAAQVVEQVGWQLLQRGLLTTLEDWLSAIPLSVRDARPSLDLYQASCALQRGESQAAQALLEHALQGFKASGDETGLGETLATLASCAFLQGDLERCGALIQQALVYPLSARAHVQLLMGRAWLHVFRHDWAQVQTDVVAALEAANQSGAADASLVIAFYLDPAFVSLPGLLEKIEHFCRQAATYCGDQIGPLQLALKELESFIHLWRGRMGETIQVGQSALEIHQRLGGYPFLGTDAAAWVAVASATQGDYATADRFFDLLTQMLARQVEQSDLIKTSQTTALYLVGRTRWLQGRLNEAHRIYGQMCMAENTPETPEAPVMRLIMRGLLEMAERRYAVAERTLRQATDLEEKIPISIVYGSARLMLAHLYLEWNHLHEALAELSPLLTECERQGVPGLVLKEGPIVVPLLRLSIAHGVHARFAARLLAMLDVDAGPAGPVRVLETGETLTPREAEILRLIVAGYSNHAIAERLVIGKPTVKSHVAHILQKLNVSSRTEAAARARELNLI
jgi:LuxR family maltose regulon positive regulatory protein